MTTLVVIGLRTDKGDITIEQSVPVSIADYSSIDDWEDAVEHMLLAQYGNDLKKIYEYEQED